MAPITRSTSNQHPNSKSNPKLNPIQNRSTEKKNHNFSWKN